MISKETIVPIVLGVALSGLSTLMSFAYSSIDEMNEELITHRLLLSKLITPDGVIAQSQSSATAKSDVIGALNKLSQDIVRIETKLFYIEQTQHK
mgnify:CR=1 FL=1|tara:strand:- start:193 stop:477 length:285 start_codon:yes stop_codon:yes gene_type:complete